MTNDEKECKLILEEIIKHKCPHSASAYMLEALIHRGYVDTEDQITWAVTPAGMGFLKYLQAQK